VRSVCTRSYATTPGNIGVKQPSICTRKVKPRVNKPALFPPISWSGIFAQEKGTPAVPSAVSLRDAPMRLERFNTRIYQGESCQSALNLL
jgi:hypothetical protein